MVSCHAGVVLGSVSLIETLVPGANAKSAEEPSFRAGTVWPVIEKLNVWLASPEPALTSRMPEVALVMVQFVFGWPAGFSCGDGMPIPASDAVVVVAVRSCGVTSPPETKKGSQKVQVICFTCQLAGTVTSCS